MLFNIWESTRDIFSEEYIHNLSTSRNESIDDLHRAINLSLDVAVTSLKQVFTTQENAKKIVDLLFQYDFSGLIGSEERITTDLLREIFRYKPEKTLSQILYGEMQEESMVKWMASTSHTSEENSQEILRVITQATLMTLAAYTHFHKLGITELAREVRDQSFAPSPSDRHQIYEILGIPPSRNLNAQISLTFGFQRPTSALSTATYYKGKGFLRKILPLMIMLLVATLFYYFIYRL